MHQRFLFFLLAAGFFFGSCGTSKFKPGKLPEDQLVFGSGGGFAGTVTEYILLENGQLFKKEEEDAIPVELERVAKEDAKYFFTEVDTMGFRQIELNEPGNIYYFIEWKTAAEDHKLLWGYDLENEVDERVKLLYDQLNTLVVK